MADKGGRASGVGVKPVPMKLFATWEVEKSSPNCIPRLCSLTLTRLIIMKSLENELQSVILAVKMQNTKRTLRSNEIIVPPSGQLDTELDLSFSLQYPHFLKRDGNKLQVMLQRRNKYKNRTILGYKTLATGQVNMAQVLQCSVDRELSLYSDLKERTSLVAQVVMLSVSSQPVDHEENGRQKLPVTVDQSPDVDMSDDEEVVEDQEFSSPDDMSDSEPNQGDDDRPARLRKLLHGPMRPRQRNLKQKFIALLRRFKVSEEVLDSEQDQELADQEANPQDIEDLFDELENLSESDPEMDTISVLSTPKPKLRPFFSGKGSLELLDMPKDSGRLSDDSSKLYDSDSHLDNLTDHELSDSQMLVSNNARDEIGVAGRRPRSPTGGRPARTAVGVSRGDRGSMSSTSSKDKKVNKHDQRENRDGQVASASDNPSYISAAAYAEPRKVLLDQLGAVLQSDEFLPENLILINTNEWHGQLLSQVLQDPQHHVICTCSPADVKATVAYVVNKIQKFCNTNSRAPAPIKIAVAGGDGYVNSVLRPYVEQFSAKSPDWQHYIKFLVIPLGGSAIGKYLSMLDGKYGSLFNDNVWRDTFEKSDTTNRPDMGEVVKRIHHYVSSASSTVQIPIAEAMLTYKEKSSDEESSQIFVPFLSEVRIGPLEVIGGSASTSVDLEDFCPLPSSVLSSSPPQSSSHVDKARDSHTPPNSPNVAHPASLPGSGLTSPAMSPPELVDLQLDYWTLPTPKLEADRTERLQKKDSKSSLKTTFRSVQVSRLHTPSSGGVPLEVGMCPMSMMVVTKEKKQKIMRIGKKSKDLESKSQMVEGINRLICTSKSQNHPLTVYIDNIEWLGVKFFQLSTNWQTHIKHFPVVAFGHTEPLL